MADTHGRHAVPRPCLVEITGVAGSGKSTLTRTLCTADGSYRRADFIHARTPSHLVYVARSIPRLLPILVANLVRAPRMSWRDFKLLVYVTEWHRFFHRRPGYSDGITLLDQGPIYALVRLRMQGSGATSSRSFRRWWNEMMTLWTDTLSLIVWLDAPDGDLRSRIENRDQPHTMKGQTEEFSQEFITRYRELFDEILGDIEVQSGSKVMRFDTGDTSTESVATEIRQALAARSGTET